MGSDSRGYLFAEYTSGKRIAGIVNALTGIFYKAGMALGGVIPGAVLAWTGYQAAAAQEGNSLPTDSNAWFVAMLICPGRFRPSGILLYPNQGACGNGREGNQEC